jgi:GntR family transcriptional regulator
VEAKYTEIMTALQDRIDRGRLPVGTLLPSEATLTSEFGTSRSTVVRALRQLRRQGWVRGVQGRGRLILGRPVLALRTLPRRIQYLLQADRHAECLSARLAPAPLRIAAALDLPLDATVFTAKYLITHLDTTPLALTTAFTATPLPQERGLLHQLESVHHRHPDHVVERIGARLSTETEATALALPHRRSVAITLLTVHDAADAPYFAVDAVLSREAPELTETYEV